MCAHHCTGACGSGSGLFLRPGSPSNAGQRAGPCWEGSCRRGRKAPVNRARFIVRPKQLSQEIRLYQASHGELHPRIVLGRLLVPAETPAHLLLRPPRQLPLESTQPASAPAGGRRLQEPREERAVVASGCRELAPRQAVSRCGEGRGGWRRGGRQSPRGRAWSSSMSRSLRWRSGAP